MAELTPETEHRDLLLSARLNAKQADDTYNDGLSARVATIALAQATIALAEQQIIANKLAVAHIDAITSYGDSPEDFRIRRYLTADEWTGLDL